MIAVVVLAHPPLWFTTAMTTGPDISLSRSKPRDYRESCLSLDNRDGNFAQNLTSDVTTGHTANLGLGLEYDSVADDL